MRIETKDVRKITNELHSISRKKNIKILLAVENGARNWGLNSHNSDFDIRFIYYQPVTKYIGLEQGQQTMNFKQGDDYDFQGMDIYKALFLLNKSNPTLLEWLRSDLIYCQAQDIFVNKMRRFGTDFYDPKALFSHYRSMGNNNYYKYIATNKVEKITYKRYLYAFRGLFNALYVYIYKELPSLDFYQDVLYSDFLPDRIKHFFLDTVIPKKRKGEDKDPIEKIRWVDEWLETTFEISKCVHIDKESFPVGNFNSLFEDDLIRMVTEQ